MRKIIVLLVSLACVSPLWCSPQKGVDGAKSVEYTEETGWDNPYVSKGLVAMWDAEWNVGYGEHDAESDVWVDLVGNNHMLLNPASTWGENCLVNAPNTKGAVGQYWANGAVTIECVMRIKGFYKYYSTPFVVYNKYSDVTYRGIGKRYEHLTNGVKYYYKQFLFSSTDVFQTSMYLKELWNDCKSYIDSEKKSMDKITQSIHTIDENAVYVNAGQFEVEYYTIRLYDRELTDAERMHNYEVDRFRFNLP